MHTKPQKTKCGFAFPMSCSTLVSRLPDHAGPNANGCNDSEEVFSNELPLLPGSAEQLLNSCTKAILIAPPLRFSQDGVTSSTNTRPEIAEVMLLGCRDATRSFLKWSAPAWKILPKTTMGQQQPYTMYSPAIVGYSPWLETIFTL